MRRKNEGQVKKPAPITSTSSQVNSLAEAQALAASDGELLDDLLEYLDVLAGVLDAIQEALATGKSMAEVEPRLSDIPPIKALDNASLDLTRKALEVRAKRALTAELAAQVAPPSGRVH